MIGKTNMADIKRFFLIAKDSQQEHAWKAAIAPTCPVVVVNMALDLPERILRGNVWTEGDTLAYAGTPTDSRVRAALIAIGCPPDLIH